VRELGTYVSVHLSDRHVTDHRNCVRTVSHTPRTLGKHGDLRGHADADRCCVKSLMRIVLVGFDVRQHARRESISKRAPSTTRTSLRLESTSCERSESRLSHAGTEFTAFFQEASIQGVTGGEPLTVARIVSDLPISSINLWGVDREQLTEHRTAARVSPRSISVNC